MFIQTVKACERYDNVISDVARAGTESAGVGAEI